MEQSPNEAEVVRHYGYLLNLCGRRREAQPWLMHLIRREQAVLKELMLLGSRELGASVAAPPAGATWDGAQDPLVRLRQAKSLAKEGRVRGTDRAAGAAGRRPKPGRSAGYARRTPVAGE